MGTVTLGRISGILIRVHFSLLFAVVLIAWLFSDALPNAAELVGVDAAALAGPNWLWGVGIAIALFLSVLVHELAHSLYARAKGGKVEDITLFVVGGASRITDEPKSRYARGMTAFLGPATSLLLGGLFILLATILRQTGSSNALFAFAYLGYLNVLLGVFNLLPAFPMDGGRILRALLEGPMGRERATQAAAVVGKIFAVIFALLGVITFNLFLFIIAILVYLGAEAESRRARRDFRRA